jgi:hypothetical protein
MDDAVRRHVAAKLGLPTSASEEKIFAFIRAARRAEALKTLREVGYGTTASSAPERSTTTVAASDGWGRRLRPHPMGGFVLEASAFTGRATADADDEALPEGWFPGHEHGRAYAG